MCCLSGAGHALLIAVGSYGRFRSCSQSTHVSQHRDIRISAIHIMLADRSRKMTHAMLLRACVIFLLLLAFMLFSRCACWEKLCTLIPWERLSGASAGGLR